MAVPSASTRTAPGAADPEAIVRRHQQGLWRYVRALGAPADLAEDLLQDTFVLALEKLHDDRGDAATAAFLRATARNLWLRRRRDQSRREALLVAAADRLWQRDCGDDDGERWLLALRACVQQLDGRAAEAVRRFYGDDQGRGAAGAALGMKETGLKTLLQRVRAALRACVEGRLGEQR
jgi:RNA polymerase sigma-70 factor (ECF subfamily)